ncbi:MAG: hypothetical protein ACREB5_03480 [Sphingomonadaceae bacterium]
MRFSSLTLGMLTVLLAAPAAANSPTMPRKLAKMDAEAFRSATTVNDDRLEFDTVISTRDGFRKQMRMNGSAWGDNHVEAHIDKRTGATRFEVHQSVRYLGSRRSYGTVHFEDRDGTLVARPIDRTRHGEDVCPNSDFNGDCSLTKQLVFSVDEKLLKTIIARDGGWSFKFKGNRSDKSDDLLAQLAPAEVEGLLLAVNDYRARLSRHASR